jgi:hypothetical protein
LVVVGRARMTALIRRNKKVVTYFSNLMVENKQAEALPSARKASTPRSVIARTPRALEGLGEIGPRAPTFLPRPPGGGAANSKPSDMHEAIDRFVYIHVCMYIYV